MARTEEGVGIAEKALLIIDADDARRQHLKGLLEFMDLGAIHTGGPSEWRYRLENDASIQVALVGPSPGLAEQIRLYDALRESRPQLPVVLYGHKDKPFPLTPEQTSGYFVRVLDLPVKHAQLLQVLQQAFQHADKDHTGARNPELFRSLVGKSDGISHVRQLIEHVANTDTTVLILGEPGTGKEVVARNLHYHSPRRGKPFIAVNCGAIPSELLESELLGHEKGAFTGAASARQGRLELAEGGTLFLDEIGDMSQAMQVKLLRVIQERRYERVGGSHSLHTDVRIIAATHRDLERDIKEARFREDLYYCLNVFPIDMPPLRLRTEDVPLLIAELNARLMRERGFSVRFAPAAMRCLQNYSWPGNVRELANLVERLAILIPNGLIEQSSLPAKYRATDAPSTLEREQAVAASLATLPAGGLDLKEHINNIEYSLIMQALTQTGGVVAHAATLLKLRRTTLVEKLRKYGVRGEIARPNSEERASPPASGEMSAPS